ncbi:MAG: hypothetical protein IH587_02700 [Anaerolineae bacterium]|nr:hypothetical protein [Anaerolineae bacterium]
MPIHMGWDDQTQRAIRFDLKGFWTWTAFTDAVADANALVASTDHEVALIFHPDPIGARHLSSDFLAQVRLIQAKRHPRMGRIVVVLHHNDTVVRHMVMVLSRVLPPATQPAVVETLADARRFVTALAPAAKAGR